MRFYRTRYFLLIVAVMLLSLISIFGYAAYNNAEFQQISNQISRANQIIAKTVGISDSTKSIVSQQKAYLITQDESFLENYQKTKSDISDDLAELAEIVSDNPSQVSRLEEFQANYLSLAEKLEEMVGTDQVNPDEAPVIFSTKQNMIELLEAILTEENEVLETRIETLAEIQIRLLAGVITGILLTGFLIVSLNYYLYKLRRENLLIGDTLSYTEERLRFALDAAQEGVFDWNIKTGHVFYSKIFCSIVGYQIHELDANADAGVDLIYPEDKIYVMDCVNKFINNEWPDYSIQFRMVHKDGHIIWVNSRAIALREEGGKAYRMIGTHRDITDHKNTQEKMERAVLEAQKSSKAKGEFLAHMSHEIRTPLTAISGISEILTKNYDDLNERQQKLVKTLATSTTSLKELINDILDFSKIESGQIELYNDYFNIGELAQEIISIMSVSATEKGLDFDVDYEAVENMRFYGDKSRIRQILLNIVGNAVKFTKSGFVKVSFTIGEFNDTYPDLIIKTKDSGIGFDEQTAKAIFSDFKQADTSVSREYGGTGLGLPISKRLAELMGGQIEATGKPDEGSEFVVTLPLISHHMNDSEGNDFSQKITDRLRSLSKHKPRALIVEDYEGNVVILSFMMEEIGMDYDVAINGQEALDMWQSTHYDIILMDVQMPIMDGITATQKMRQMEKENNFEETPIIGMTAHALIEDKDKCIKCGMSDYLPKPLNIDLLKEKILKLTDNFDQSNNKKTGT